MHNIVHSQSDACSHFADIPTDCMWKIKRRGSRMRAEIRPSCFGTCMSVFVSIAGTPPTRHHHRTTAPQGDLAVADFVRRTREAQGDLARKFDRGPKKSDEGSNPMRKLGHAMSPIRHSVRAPFPRPRDLPRLSNPEIRLAALSFVHSRLSVRATQIIQPKRGLMPESTTNS